MRQTRLVKVPRDGGTQTTLASLETDLGGCDFTLYDGYFYWCDSVLHKLPSDGGGAESTVDQSKCLEKPLGAAGYLYYIGLDDSQGDVLYKQSSNGGAPSIVEQGRPAMAVNANSFFWAKGSTLKASDHSSGTVRTLSENITFSPSVADDNAIYGIGADGIWKLPLSGGNPVRLTSETADRLLVDSTHLYFLAQNGIARVPLAGGDPEWLVTEGAPWSSLALDPDYVYWVNNLVPPTVKRLAK